MPKDLLELRRFKGHVRPKFAGTKEIELAKRVLELYEVGRKLGEVRSRLRLLEDAKSYRKVRAFAKIVERMCEFEVETDLDPKAVRRFLFERGYVTTLRDRERVIRECAEVFGVSEEEVERAMFADLEEERRIVKVPELSPKELVKLYNLSLLQTALFNSLRLTFWVDSNHKRIFRAIKWLGLMYELHEKDGMLLVSLTGTASIVKMTRKYGTSMAKLVPEIIRARRWWLRAEILDEHSKRIYFLELSDAYDHLFPKDYEDRIEYDSSLEEEFSRRLKFLLEGCEIVREPGVVRAGRYAYIPDFLIRKGEREVYVEIAGFWTEEYIRRKLEKIELANIPLVLVVREDLALEKPKGVLDVVTIRKGRIPYREILQKIKRYLES